MTSVNMKYAIFVLSTLSIATAIWVDGTAYKIIGTVLLIMLAGIGILSTYTIGVASELIDLQKERIDGLE